MAEGGECEYCGEKSFMPYRCRYCNGLFCPDHRLPENHDCPGLKGLRENPRWRDYAKQVHRRSEASGTARSGRWDREEERGFPGRSFLAGGASSEVESVKRILIFILIISLAAAIVIHFL